MGYINPNDLEEKLNGGEGEANLAGWQIHSLG
jgi:hypothetical protein